MCFARYLSALFPLFVIGTQMDQHLATVCCQKVTQIYNQSAGVAQSVSLSLSLSFSLSPLFFFFHFSLSLQLFSTASSTFAGLFLFVCLYAGVSVCSSVLQSECRTVPSNCCCRWANAGCVGVGKEAKGCRCVCVSVSVCFGLVSGSSGT